MYRNYMKHSLEFNLSFSSSNCVKLLIQFRVSACEIYELENIIYKYNLLIQHTNHFENDHRQ